MRRIVLFTAVVVLGAGIAAACGPFKAPPPQFPNVEAQFLATCSFSHRLPDDPIVFPNSPGASHSHDFLGSNTTNAASTASSLQAGGTTCQPTNDKTGYWVPTVYVGGNAVPPVFANFYYRGNKRDFQSVVPFPPGFKMIAGTAMATSPQPMSITSWGCTNVSGNTSEIPSCPAGERLKLSLFFPDCWDGVNLDSADHKSHLSYRVNGSCPASHPVRVPQLQFFIVYATTGGPSTTVACGSQYCGHGDFFNGWNQSVLEVRVAGCINAGVKCDKNGFPE